ncbi:VOC family protein [Streptomyces griseorubiginosus]|uniref:VOC family protein n=1 Tax=Streptomyces griseorubiginosus TaxID=67304 RepID=UPI00365C44C3
MNRPTHGTLHHVELWVPDLDRAVASLGLLLEALGYGLSQSWNGDRSWRLGPTYLVIEQSPALTAERHDRRCPGLNHLAFHVEDAATVEKLTASKSNSSRSRHPNETEEPYPNRSPRHGVRRRVPTRPGGGLRRR